MTIDQLENFAAGVLSAAIDDTTTTIPVKDASLFPDPSDTSSGGTYRCVIYDSQYTSAQEDPNHEIVDVTGRDTTNDELTVTRGVENTSASSHPSSSIVYNARTAAYRDQVQSLFDDANTKKIYVSTQGDDTNNGQSWRDAFATVSKALEYIRNNLRDGKIDASFPKPVTIKVDSGIYQVDNPLHIPRRVSIMGTDPRSTQFFPQLPKADFIHADSLTFFWGVRFYDHQYPAFTVSFPRVVAEPTVDSNGAITNIDVIYSPDGYLDESGDEKPQVVIDPPRNGTQAKADVVINNGKVTDIDVTNQGSGYQTKPNVSIPAPEEDQPYVFASPYPLNCSTITGPFDVNGKQIPRTAPLPYNVDNPEFYNPIAEEQQSFAAVDPQGAGGGILIDGRLTYGRNGMTDDEETPKSPIPSMVSAQFTQVNQGGAGHLIINDGFGQFVSDFTTYCTYSYKAKTGGLALISNSVTDFGVEGLIAEGKGLNTYTSGGIVNDKYSSVGEITVDNPGSGYTDSKTSIDIDDPANGTDTATADPIIDDGEVVGVTVTNSGSGYETTPDAVVNGDGSGATLSVQMSKVGTITVENLDEITQPGGNTIDRTPDVNSIIEIGSNERVVSSWSDIGNGEYEVTFRPGVFKAESSQTADFYQMSNINSGGHVFEFPGAGYTYNALPSYGGQPDLSQMVKEFGSGRVYHTSSDSFGNFYVGDQFQVDQQTGKVTLNTDDFDLSGLNNVGPFETNGVIYGTKISEVSNQPNLTANRGASYNDTTVPTIQAIRDFFITRDRTIPNGGADGQALVKQSSTDRDADWEDVVLESEFDANINIDGSPLSDSDTINFITQ